MLTPIDLHYVVGLLTAEAESERVELELGAMVFDDAGGKERDVDVTIRRRSDSKADEGFTGIEVKAHKRPLDIIVVEQLSRKLNDMGELSTRAIVSASGYTDPARRKAEYHGVELLRLDDWDSRYELGTEMTNMTSNRRVLELHDARVMFIPSSPEKVPFPIDDPLLVTAPDGGPLEGVQDTNELGAGMIRNVTAHFVNDTSVAGLQPDERKPVECNLDIPPVRIWGKEQTIVVERVHVVGFLAWKVDTVIPTHKVLVRDHDDSPFIGCSIMEAPDGSLIGIAVHKQPGPLTYFCIPTSDRNRKKIYQQKWPVAKR